MSTVVSGHPDEFMLLRLVAGDTDELEAARLGRHVRVCTSCGESLAATRHLDEALREHAEEILAPSASEELSPEDPFARRPSPGHRRFEELQLSGRAVAEVYARARRDAGPLQATLLSALARGSEGTPVLSVGFDLDRLADRLALGYTLDESVRLFADGPRRWLRFALESAARLGGARGRRGTLTLEEFAYPVGDLLGRAHTVAGWALNWLGEFDRAGAHLATAYRSFGEGSGSLHDLAMVELHESQRRSFVGRPAEALHLAIRSAATFEALTLDVPAAKARFAEGLALSYLGRDAEAVPLFESALEPLAREGLWNAWVSVLNDLGTSHLELGQYARARRAYAQALRRVSREQYPGVHAFVRFNLGLIHLRCAEPRRATDAFADAADLFEAQGATADALNARLHQIESLARQGETGRARGVLARFEEEVTRHGALDPSTLRAIGQALSGQAPDLARLADLRETASAILRERLAAG